MSAERRELKVYWKGQPPAAAASAAADARREASVRVMEARYSEAELLAEADRLIRMDGVTAVSPNVDGTGLAVSFAPGRRGPITSGVPITQTDTAAPQLTSRGNDSAPYWGGAQWSGPNGGCSTGFAISIGGVSKMLSAGHCAANGNTARDGGGDVMGTVSGDNDSRDRLYINTSSAGRIFDYLCTSGAYSGARCNIQVKAVNQTINIGYPIYGTVRAEQLNRTSVTSLHAPLFLAILLCRAAARW